MPTAKRTVDFLISDEGVWCRTALETMEQDAAFHTEPSFTSDEEHFPDNLMPFVMTHMNYLTKHAEVNPRQYISNLRLRSRKLS